MPVQLAAAIEAVLWTTETRESYGRATRRIVFALRRNDQLRRRVLDGSLTPAALAALDEEALAPPAVAQRRADDGHGLPSASARDHQRCPKSTQGSGVLDAARVRGTWPTRRTRGSVDRARLSLRAMFGVRAGAQGAPMWGHLAHGGSTFAVRPDAKAADRRAGAAGRRNFKPQVNVSFAR